MTGRFAELAAMTAFSFLRAGSRPEEYVAAASFYGVEAIGIADRNTVAGVVRAYTTLTNPELPRPVKLLPGARLVFEDGSPDIVVHPYDRAAWGRLCRLLSIGKQRAKKGECLLRLSDLLDWGEGLNAIVMPPPHPGAETRAAVEALRGAFPKTLWLGATMPRRGDDGRRLSRLKRLADRCRVPLIATNEPLYHTPERRALQDVVTCIREGLTLETAGRILEANAERHLKPAAEMERLFRDAPEAVAETLRYAERIVFSLDDLKYNYPSEPIPAGKTPHGHLRDLVREGVKRFYPQGAPRKVEKLLAKELAFIKRENYAHYFLTVHDIVAFAQSIGVLCQGRGSAANSAVCYVLGVTAVDPAETDVLFERFLSKERSEPPDIDVDFEHERREEVIQYIYERYGRHRAALAATVIHYKPRSAIREVGKVFGLSEDISAALAGTVWGSWGSGLDEVHVRQAGLDPQNPYLKRAVAIASELVGFPRHLSQHVGGFVLTQDRLDEIVPVGPAAMADRSFIEWDKDDIDALKIMKVDVLALGMLTCIRKAFDLIRAHDGEDLSLASVPKQDDEVYAMLSRADSLGVFQVESRAQMNMLPRLRPKEFYDLVIEVAIVRPGPIQGDMVHPYLAQRAKDPASIVYPGPAPEHGEKDELKKVLEKTLGVPLFQEQAMRIAMVAAKFSGEEANALRRSMATFRNRGGVDVFRDKMVGRMIARGYDPEFANRCFKQIEGFGSYGFPESHAASFAKLVYVSSWLKCRHPAAFACALLNAQPMGFYAPAEIVRDAREHGVEVRGADIAVSFWDNTLERRPDGALRIRLGFRQIEGFRQEWAKALVAARSGFFTSIEELRRRTRLPKAALVKLADADAFRSMKLDRRAALWEVRRLPDDVALPLFEAADAADHASEATAPLPAMPLTEHVVADYQTTRLSLKGHPMQFLRTLFSGEGAVSCAEVRAARDGRRLKAAGVVLVRQKPGSAKGVVFMTIADETGVANAVIWPTIMARFRKEVMGSRLVLIEGRVQRSPEGVVHLVAESLVDRSREFGRLSERELKPQLSNADEFLHPQMERGARPRIHPRDVRIMPKSRDFH